MRCNIIHILFTLDMSYLLKSAVKWIKENPDEVQRIISKFNYTDKKAILYLVIQRLNKEHVDVYGANVGTFKDENGDLDDCLCDNCIWVEMGCQYNLIEDFMSQ